MRKAVLISALALLAVGATTIAVAQVGPNGEVTPAGDPVNHATECAEESKQDGAFGACVSERASAFGRCVADAANDGQERPAEECADLKPERGNGNGPNGNGPNGSNNGTNNGNGNGNGITAASNPTEGVESSPSDGREFGHEVAGNAGGNPGGNAEGRNPTEGVESSPSDGREFGHEVAGNAGGNPGGERRGPPENAPAP